MQRLTLLWLDNLNMQENNLSIKKFRFAIAWFFVVLVLVCLPGYDLPRTQDWMHKLYLDKWIHTTIFGFLAFLFMSPIPGSGLSRTPNWLYFFRSCIAGCVGGLPTELIQKYFFIVLFLIKVFGSQPFTISPLILYT